MTVRRPLRRSRPTGLLRAAAGAVVERLEKRLVLAAAGLITTPQTYSGVLNDKVVFCSGGHGWQWNDTLGRYATDRGDNNEIVEDFGNQEQLTAFADYALCAGATVVPMRPIGRQINEVVLDNDSPGVTFSTGWSNSVSTKYYDEDYDATQDSIPYKYAGTVTGTATATATYLPNIPQAGFYPVYTWVLYGTDRTEQTYTINHTGGSTEVTVNHSIVGSGWIYLGTYHFNAGSSATGEGSVVITNKAPATGDVVIADAIRFGNGMGDWIDTPTGATTVSGYPREDENSFHWIARAVGVGTSLTTATGASTDNNVSAPSNFAQYMYHGVFGGAVYIGFHSNAGGGRGARGLIDSSAPTPNQDGTNGLADILGDQINQDMQALNGVFEFNWTTGTTSTYTSQFGEINLGSGAEMDATIIEVAFHDDASDAAIMRDPNGRDQIARSVYQGTVQYFSLYGSPTVTNTSLPTPPTAVRVVSNASGAVTLNWSAGPTTPSGVYGAAATGYKVYASVDGYGFDGGRVVSGVGTTTLTITGLDPTIPYYFKVASTNAGGESKASEVITVLPSGGAKQVLIVNGFDRFDRTQNFRYAYLGGTVDRVWPRWNNSFDYVNRVERALQTAKPGMHVANTSNEAVISGAVNLTDYKAVIWILGNESTDDDTFNATEQTKVTAFLAAGGSLFLSGSEIAWDLDQQNNGRSFFESTLKGNYVADDAATYTATVVASPGIFSGLSSFVFSSGSTSTVYSTRDDQVYDVSTPDVISPQSGAAGALAYSTSTAGIQVGTGGIGTGSIVMFGFPVETMTSETRRQQAMGRVLDFLGAGIDVETRVNGQDADSVTGPVLATGSSATLTYIVTNPGIVSLTASVVDDNGTPGTTADDFSPTLSSGDTNSNNLLDVGETWTYTATRTVVAGQRTHSGKAIGVASTTTVTKGDVANYFGSAPAITLQTSVAAQDADIAPGPTLAAGGSTTFTYVLTNGGNVALNTVVVTDNNGTPGNTADDFSPTFTGGDTNSNSQLDLGETWTYSASRTVVAGQYSNSSSVSAKDSINTVVNSSDPTNYFGSAPAINLQVSANGQDADTAPGPSVAAGSSVSFSYTLTNTGNVAVNTVVVVDNNGTPGNAADDFNPTFSSGDTNSNGFLDLSETWTYTATRTAVVGQYSNSSSASAKDSINQVVNSSDPTNYFGAVSATPGTPDLLAATDSGVSDTDNITLYDNHSAGTALQFTIGNTVAGATVTLYEGDTIIASVTATGTSTTISTPGNSAYSGLHDFSATQSEPGKAVSPRSSAVTVNVDVVKPTAVYSVDNGAPTPGSAYFDFVINYGDVDSGMDTVTFDSNDVLVTNIDIGYSATASFVSDNGNAVTYRMSAPGGTWNFADSRGNYTFTSAAGEVKDVAGNARGADYIVATALYVPFAWIDTNVLHVEFFDDISAQVTMTVNGSQLDLHQSGLDVLSFPLADFTSVLVQGSNTLDTLDFTGPMSQPITFNGGVGGDALNIHAGTFTFAADAGASTLNLDVNVDNGAVVVFDATQHLDSLTVNGNAGVTLGGAKVLVVNDLIVGANGQLDLRDNDLVINYSTLSPIGSWAGSAYNDVSGLIQTGRHGGAWDGKGIIASPAAGTPLHGLGIAEASQILPITGTDTAVFSGETVDGSSVLVKYTYVGDANLSGRINIDDYGRIDFSFTIPDRNGWFNGDFNYDGKLNIDDYGLIDLNIGAQGTAL